MEPRPFLMQPMCWSHFLGGPAHEEVQPLAAVQFLKEKGQREARPGIFLWLDPGEGRGWGPSAKGRDPGEGQDQYR